MKLLMYTVVYKVDFHWSINVILSGVIKQVRDDTQTVVIDIEATSI